jgi:hypothetical protein
MFGKGGKPIPFDIPIPTSGVALFVDGRRVELSSPATAVLAHGSERAAEEIDQKSGRKGVPMEVRHFRD